MTTTLNAKNIFESYNCTIFKLKKNKKDSLRLQTSNSNLKHQITKVEINITILIRSMRSISCPQLKEYAQYN